MEALLSIPALFVVCALAYNGIKRSNAVVPIDHHFYFCNCGYQTPILHHVPDLCKRCKEVIPKPKKKSFTKWFRSRHVQ